MTPRAPRVLLSAYQCAPGQGSVSQIGWEWYSRLAQRVPVTLVTHCRNREAIEAAGGPLPGSAVEYIDTEWFAGRLYRFAKGLFPSSEHAVFLLSSLDYFVYDWAAVRQMRPRRSEWDLAHAVTPVSPSAFSLMSTLGLPFVRGPLNGGLRTPSTFPQFMKADSAWMYRLRGLADLPRAFASLLPKPTLVLSANAATDAALPRCERAVQQRMHEIAVDTEQYAASAWPQAPSKTNPLRILFVGRLIAAKALPLLTESLRRLGVELPFELTVAGDGPMRARWEQDAADLGTRVRFVGSLQQDAVASELRRAHVLCLPSVRESGGAVLLEAMSSARPVVAVNYGGPAGIVRDAFGKLVSSSGPEQAIPDLTETWRDMFANPEAWAKRGEAGRVEAVQRHSWDARVERMLECYERCLSSAANRVAGEFIREGMPA